MMIHWLLTTALAQPPKWIDLPICQSDPSACEMVYSTQPRPTRNPALHRFTEPELANQKWVPVHVARLTDSNTPENVQLALITVLQQSNIQAVEDSLLPLFQADSPELRAGMTELLPKLKPDTQQDILIQLLQDTDWLVRSQTIRVVARHLGTVHPDVLVKGMEDSHPEVRIHAVKGLGWNNVSVPITQLSPLLYDDDANVRLHTLRTIERLHPGSAVKLGLLDTLLDDPDSKVQREILRIQKAY